MTLAEQLAAEHANFDPHGLKNKGELTPRHAFVNEPYTYQEFPKVMHKQADGKLLTTTVNDSDQLDKAKGEGFSETPPALVESAPALSSGEIVAYRKQFLNAAGQVVGESEAVKITAVAPSGSVEVALSGADGSGTGRYVDNWTQESDGTNYPAHSYGTGLEPFVPLRADAPEAQIEPAP
jgi:hypothetical protein